MKFFLENLVLNIKISRFTIFYFETLTQNSWYSTGAGDGEHCLELNRGMKKLGDFI